MVFSIYENEIGTPLFVTNGSDIEENLTIKTYVTHLSKASGELVDFRHYALPSMAKGALVADNFRVCIENLTDPVPKRRTVQDSGQRILQGGQPRIAQHLIVADRVRLNSRKGLRSTSTIKFLNYASDIGS